MEFVPMVRFGGHTRSTAALFVVTALWLLLVGTPGIAVAQTCTDDGLGDNHSFDDALEIAPGSYPDLQICGGADYFRIALRAGDRVEVAVRFRHAAGDLDVNLYGPDESTLTVSNGVDDNELLVDNAPDAAFYFVKVYGYLGAENGYDLRVTRRAMERVSVDSAGRQGNAHSYQPALSEDGRVVAFRSVSPLVAGDSNSTDDIFVHERDSGLTTRVSVSSDGTQANAFSWVPSISAIGRRVAFLSVASNLVAGDTNGEQDVFVHDRFSGETRRVNVASDGSESTGSSEFPMISPDGGFVVFQSLANDLVAPLIDGQLADTNGNTDVFLHDMSDGSTRRVSVHPVNGEGDRESVEPSVGAGGACVAYASEATNLVDVDANDSFDVFVWSGGQTRRVSIGVGGEESNGVSRYPAISADCAYVAFFSEASNLVDGDYNGVGDIFLHEIATGETRLVSVASDGSQGESSSHLFPSISKDGSQVAFQSQAETLVGDDSNGALDVFVHDRDSGETRRVSEGLDGEQGTHHSIEAAISGSGQVIAFASWATDLIDGDSNGQSDIFVQGAYAYDPSTLAAGLRGPRGKGWMELISAIPPYQSRQWHQVDWPAYAGSNGETRPAWCDLDGDGRDELVVGLGPGGQGWLEVRDDRWSGLGPLDWVQVDWSRYNQTNGETWPACGDIDGDGRDELVIGLGAGGGGWVQVLDDQAADFAPMQTNGDDGWLQLRWSDYNKGAAGGEVRPAVGNIDGDESEEIAFGLASGGGGWFLLVDDAASGFTPMPSGSAAGWHNLDWPGYGSDNGETWPAFCGGGLVVGLGAGSDGWMRVFESLGPLGNLVPSQTDIPGWLQLDWQTYTDANGTTRPTCADSDQDGYPELITGLGKGGSGYMRSYEYDAVLYEFVAAPESNGWHRVDWLQYDRAAGDTFPALSR